SSTDGASPRPEPAELLEHPADHVDLRLRPLDPAPFAIANNHATERREHDETLAGIGRIAAVLGHDDGQTSTRLEQVAADTGRVKGIVNAQQPLHQRGCDIEMAGEILDTSRVHAGPVYHQRHLGLIAAVVAVVAPVTETGI